MNVTVNNSDVEVFEIANKKIAYERYFIYSNFFNIINTIEPNQNATKKEKDKYQEKIEKNEKLMVVFKNVKVDGCPVFDLNLMNVFKQIQNNKDSKKYIQTKNQHYLKQSIQKKWDNSYIYAFSAHAKKFIGYDNVSFIPPVYEHVSYDNTILINAKECLNISDFNVKNIGTDDNTYTLFMHDTVIFIEGLLVNKIEDFIEGLVKKKNFNNIDKNMVLFLTKSNYKKRIYSVQKLAYTIYKEKINDFYINCQNQSDIQITPIRLEKEVFNLHIGWVLPFYPAFFFGLDCNLIPVTPYEALIISLKSNESQEELIKILKNLDQSYFDINSYSFEIYNLYLQKDNKKYEDINICETKKINTEDLILYRKNNIIKTNHNKFLERIVLEDIKNMSPYVKEKTIIVLLENGHLISGFNRSINLIRQKIINDFNSDSNLMFMMDIYFEQLFLYYNTFYEDFDYSYILY